MAEAILQPLLHALDPISLILSQKTSQSDQPIPLSLTTTDSLFCALERGVRYKEYAQLRESKLRLKSCFKQGEEKDCNFTHTPPKKQVKFQTHNLGSKKGGAFSSILTQSVPDFSATLRKENRKPPPPPPQELTLTPPGSGSKYWPNVGGGVLSGSKGSKSADSGGEKRNRNGRVIGGRFGLMARKSYANVEQLRGLGLTASSAINGVNKGGKGGGGGSREVGYGKAVLGYRQF